MQISKIHSMLLEIYPGDIPIISSDLVEHPVYICLKGLKGIFNTFLPNGTYTLKISSAPFPLSVKVQITQDTFYGFLANISLMDEERSYTSLISDYAVKLLKAIYPNIDITQKNIFYLGLFKDSDRI